MRTLVAALTTLILFAAPVVAGDREDMDAAIQAGDYKKAFPQLKRLAEQGNVSQQFFLGRFYIEGKGVPENDAKAVYWFRRAADQGHASAQYYLGYMYENGKGVPKNDAQAYVWLSIAAAQGHTDAKLESFMVKQKLTHEQIMESQKLSSEYWKKYVVPFQKE